MMDIYYGRDYYGDIGCCLTCTEYLKRHIVEGYSEDAYGNCICFSCKCTKCKWYHLDGYNGYCILSQEGLIRLTADWNRGYISIKIMHTKKEKFKEIVEILKGYKFVFLEDKKEWIKPIDRNTLYNVMDTLSEEVAHIDFCVKGTSPREYEQSTIDYFECK